MKTIIVPAKEQVSTQAQAIFEEITKKLGKVPNLFATIGYSADALKGILQFEDAFTRGAFDAKEREGINLVVSQVNNCDYCLAAHTMLATMKGFSKEDTIAMRKGQASDSRFQAALQLAKEIAENKGNASSAAKEAFFSAGYQEAALIELTGLVTVRTFTNYVFALTEIPVDFPPAPALN